MTRSGFSVGNGRWDDSEGGRSNNTMLGGIIGCKAGRLQRICGVVAMSLEHGECHEASPVLVVEAVCLMPLGGMTRWTVGRDGGLGQ